MKPASVASDSRRRLPPSWSFPTRRAPPAPDPAISPRSSCRSRSCRLLENKRSVFFRAPFGGQSGMLEPARSFAPIHHRPPALQIIGAPVFVFKVVGVLPHIVDQTRKVALRHGIVMAVHGQDIHFP